MLDVYAYWRLALAGNINQDAKLRTGEGADDSPQPGLYKVAAERGGQKVPLSIMIRCLETDAYLHQVSAFDPVAHEIVALLNGEPVDAVGYFSYAIPISKADLAHYNASGMWPGEIAPARGIGHNSGGVDLTLFEQLDEAITLAVEYVDKTPVINQITADMSSNHASRVREIKGALDKERMAKVRPHLDAQAAINDEYKPHIARADDAIARVNAPREQWMRAEKARLEEESKRLAYEENARRQAEYARQRAEAEAAHKAAAEAAAAANAVHDAPIAPVEPLPELPAPPVMVVAEPVKVLTGGQRGKRSGLRTVTDYVCDSYAETLAAVCEHDEVRAAVLKVARARMKSGVAVPGMRAVQNEVL